MANMMYNIIGVATPFTGKKENLGSREKLVDADKFSTCQHL